MRGVCLNSDAAPVGLFSPGRICANEDVLVRLVKSADFAGGRGAFTPIATAPNSMGRDSTLLLDFGKLFYIISDSFGSLLSGVERVTPP